MYDLDPTEPAERLTDRAIEGYDFIAEVARREKRRLLKRLQRKGRLDDAEAHAAVNVVIVAAATISPLNRKRMEERFRRELIARGWR
jgi:hypothetical protein